jgi:methylated-DNA-[protein]-cysteine S-methyltransferase
MGMHGYALFDTTLGRCAVAWTERGIAAVELPGSDDAATLRRIARALPQAGETTPPAHVQTAIDAITALFAGEPDDLTAIELDLDDVPEFHRRVYAAARAIPPGETRSYGDLARALGEPGAAQAVGRALGANPVPIVVPCHRVLAANGALHGFSAPGGIDTKRRMLALEGAGPPTLFD